ncbi:protein-methionine-sulfoxide reductase heme-binding subunit MsrQ [Salinimonas sediminis]|uniref:Protein-methionine-sulfoxide reductase heme-binding subunit MsrQ n=1 Tax=Salinimonas sediminis TaxID=2303538 RepID=A0A346NSE1_9ALTE|nr:protein-methionine-sulfoxide reductase heme-binding subunit MsrQ [Salinimonas sediminis]AXR08448.1 sulfoxide reductase heme-binding subunit YedZ [Salinimonas sediminis]
MRRLLKRPLRLSRAQVFVGKLGCHCIIAGLLGLTFFFGFTDQLGADPVDTLINFTGRNAIHLLLISLLVSPAAKHIPCGDIMRFRRMLGVYVFVYALAHFLVYVLFELQLNWALIFSEITERPYIVVGMLALLLLLAMTATSFKRIQQKMGKHWHRLHNTIYLCVPLVLLHFSWSQKTLFADPLVYWVVAAAILWLRKDKLLRLIPFNK